ncbi:DUF3592 domain-containing protein [Gallaecimonas xiamenensis]|uniref:DUF3592 domain-containing protein n=1 Tax=Gallaecimonas xiamenensis 3-C-1 TaxID=745411 RepID=K2J2L2_9GAMM|nr:DUF3592 domain-containing protein [Gallaecimonas xiamenensis]EKE77176.1 hypothetical protein B3C1_03185 [Gallaecimonas xiamenensis 3-C-1]
MNKTIARICLIFGALGLIMSLAAGYLAWSKVQFIEGAQQVEGEVIDLHQSRSSGSSSSSYYPEILYVTQSGEALTHVSSTGSSPPAYDIGERVPVYYDPKNPRKVEYGSGFSLYGAAIILGILGGTFLIPALVWLVVTRRSAGRIKRLKESGHKVLADIKAVEEDGRISVNGRFPYLIVAQWQDPKTQLVYRFTSDQLWFDPSDFLDRDQVAVLIDPANPSCHWMDIGFLPKQA